jgi:pSer/pThr/pTyr-binding forkhead associated (FHA) protein
MNQEERRFVVGRARECDIVLADESVSRQHAELIFMEGGKLFLVDRKSQNGTFLVVNERPRQIRQELVSPTDTVQFGEVRIPMEKLLEAIRLKFPSFGVTPVQAPPPPEQPAEKPWVQAKRLVRCACGAVIPAGAVCPECERPSLLF